MTVEDFRHVFLRICKDHNLEPQDCVLNALSSAQKLVKSGGYCLNLSTHSITPKTCAVLGKVFSTDRTFTEIKFNDCMLPEEGLRVLAHGFSQNVTCRKLDLKGNNIRGVGAEALGRMLRQNQTLISLCLEWNALGMIDTSFGTFCEGLGLNTRLQVLDLRNNQISHDGGTDLAASLKSNSILRVLDLRWNHIGLIGGRQLISALHSNNALVKLELAGNNTPEDIMKSIDTAVMHNADRVSLSKEFQTRQRMLSQEITDLRKTKADEVSHIMDKADRQEAALKKSNKDAAKKISQLHDALQERKDQFNNCASKLAMAESELALSESKIKELNALLSKSKEDSAAVGQQHTLALKREREDRAVLEAKLTRENISLNDKLMQQENQIDEIERKNKHLQEQIFDLKEQITHSQADSKMKAGQYEDKLQYEKQKRNDMIKDLEESKSKQIEQVRRESDDNQRILEEKLKRMDLMRIENEETISQLKTSVAEERLRCEQHILEIRQKVKAEEEQKIHGIEEKLRVVQTAKDEMTSHSAHQAASITDLQTKNSNLLLENESLKRKIENMNQEISGKNNEIMTEVEKAKIELTQKIHRLEKERYSQAELYDKVASLEKELTELKHKYTAACSEKDTEIARLQERFKTKEEELKYLKEEERQRALMLQSAIASYLKTSPQNTSTTTI